MADNPQQTVRELRELVVAYAKQETVDPIKGLGRYAGFGVLGSVLMGMGIVFLEIGVLRLLQGWGAADHGHRFNGNMSWAPYAIVVVSSIIIAALIWAARGKRKAKNGDNKKVETT